MWLHLLVHPDAPRDRPGFLISHWAARHLEGQLYLTVMIAFVADHVLKQEDRMVIVKVYVAACSTLLFTASRTAFALSFSICAMRSGSRSTTHSSSGTSPANSGASSKQHYSYIVDVCEHSAMDGLPSLPWPPARPQEGRAAG